ncbi:MAG: ribose 5-phosphate isomerase B [Rickettsiales bacterium]
MSSSSEEVLFQGQKIAVGSDHAGYDLKESALDFIVGQGADAIDCGADSDASCDYPVFAKKVADAILQGRAEKGVLICGSGVGMSIVANRFPGIRAALCFNADMAKLARQHNDANILVMGARLTHRDAALAMVERFFLTDFHEGRHSRRVALIDDNNVA